MHKFVTTKLIELIIMRIGGKLLEGINPILVINHGVVMIQRRIPVKVAGECDVGKGVPFFVGVRSGKAIANLNRNDVSIGGNHGLKTTKHAMLLADPDAKHLKLCRGKNHATTTVVCLLVHDGNDRSSLGFGDTTSRADLLVSNLVTIKTSDIDAASCEVDDANVITTNTTIGTSINKSAIVVLTLLVVGNVVRALSGWPVPIGGMPSEVPAELSEVRSHIVMCHWMVLVSRFTDFSS